MATKFVKIGTWDDMEKEYGLSAGKRYIKLRYGFTKEMEDFMPKDRIIQIYDNIWKPENHYFMISDPMIEEDYGEIDPRLDALNIIDDKEVIVYDPDFNTYETINKWYIPATKLPENKEGYLHSDLIVTIHHLNKGV